MSWNQGFAPEGLSPTVWRMCIEMVCSPETHSEMDAQVISFFFFFPYFVLSMILLHKIVGKIPFLKIQIAHFWVPESFCVCYSQHQICPSNLLFKWQSLYPWCCELLTSHSNCTSLPHISEHWDSRAIRSTCRASTSVFLGMDVPPSFSLRSSCGLNSKGITASVSVAVMAVSHQTLGSEKNFKKAFNSFLYFSFGIWKHKMIASLFGRSSVPGLG